MPDKFNDNHTGEQAGRAPDPHGQAALLLVESLIHTLIARKLVSVADALETVEVAVEVKTDLADNLGDSANNRAESLALLEAIAASLQIDRE